MVRVAMEVLHMLADRRGTPAVTVLVFVIMGLTGLSPAAAQGPIPGAWNTNYGALRIAHLKPGYFIGHYSYKRLPANLFGKSRGKNIYEGIWIQRTSEVRCRSRAKGSPYWGRFRFAFMGPNRFVGLWSYCGRRLAKKKGHIWRGALARASVGAGRPLTSAGAPSPAPPLPPSSDGLMKKLQGGLNTPPPNPDMVEQFQTPPRPPSTTPLSQPPLAPQSPPSNVPLPRTN